MKNSNPVSNNYTIQLLEYHDHFIRVTLAHVLFISILEILTVINMF